MAAQIAADVTRAVGALSDDEIIIVEFEIEQQVCVGAARLRFQQIAQARQAAVGERAPGRMGREQALGVDLYGDVISHPVLDVRVSAAVGNAAFTAACGNDGPPNTGSKTLPFWRAHQVLSIEPKLCC